MDQAHVVKPEQHSNVAAKEELYSDINMCPILIIFLTAKRLSRFSD